MKMVTLISAILGAYLWAQEPALTQEQCPTVDLSDQFGPVRNQGKISSCFAFAVADLIGYSTGVAPAEQVSAIDVQMNMLAASEEEIRAAINNQKSFSNVRMNLQALPFLIEATAENKAKASPLDTFERGFTWLAAMAYNVRNGICTEKQMPSTGPQAAVGSDFFVREQIGKLTHYAKDADFLNRLWLRLPFSPSLFLLEQITFSKRTAQTPCTPKTNPLRRNAEFIEGTFKQMYRDMDKKLEKACTPRKPIPPLMSIPIDLNDNGAQKAAQMLRNVPPIPFVWSYDPRFLKENPDTVGAKQNANAHASVVVGMHWDGKQCQFKVRNSWGINCEEYHSSLRAGCKDGVVDVNANLFGKYSHRALVIGPQENTESKE